MSQQIIGIDLGGTTVKIGIVSESGIIDRQWSITTDTSGKGENIIPDIVSSIKDYLSSNKIDIKNIKGIGMGSPGKIDYIKGTVSGAYNLGWSSTQEVKKVFDEAFPCPFYLENDANVAALGEHWKGAGQKAPNVIFVTLGTGVGGGIIVENKLFHGANGSAGEIGHMVVSEHGYPCTCGNEGCLETVASATGIMNLAKIAAGHCVLSNDLREMIRNDQATVKDIFDYAKENNPLAIHVVDEFAQYLGEALSQLANAFNPDYIVIGGGVSAAGTFLLDKVEKAFEKHVFPTVGRSTKLVLASLGNDAGILGAASLTLG